jgi:flagellar hook-length control protein FliK
MPADGSTLAAGMLRPAASGAAAPGISPALPAGTPAPADTSTGSLEPFAALLLGFLQGTQPAAPALSTPAANTDNTELLPTDAQPETVALPGILPLPAAELPTTTASAVSATGQTLPASGSRLPPGTDEQFGGQTIAAQPAAEADTGMPATRISLADIEYSQRLNMVTTTPLQAGTPGKAFMPAATTEPFVTGAETDSTIDLLSGEGIDSSLHQPASLTAGDLSRLMQHLTQNGGREPVSAAFQIDGNDMNASLGSTGTGSSQSVDAGLARLTRGSLGGFPPLQPLGPAEAWTAGLGDRLLTLAGPGTHSARIKLHPESLGTLDIEVRISDSTAQIWFGTPHSQTREAIEASLPQLREMFAEQGIRLAHAQVDSGTDPRGRDQQQAFDAAERPNGARLSAPATSSLPDRLAPLRQPADRLLDAWA